MSGLTFAVFLASLCVVAHAQYDSYYAPQTQGCYWGTCNDCCYCCGSYSPPYQGENSYSTATASSSSSAGWTNPGYSGVYYDAISVEDGQHIKDSKTACQAFLEQYTEAIVQPKQLVQTIQKTFYGSAALAKQNRNGLNPSTFHCCMQNHGAQIYNKKPDGKYPKAALPKDVTCASLEKDLLKNIKQPAADLPKMKVVQPVKALKSKP